MSSKPLFASQICLFLIVSLAKGFQQRELKSTVAPLPSRATPQTPEGGRLDSGGLTEKDRALSPVRVADPADEGGLVEVKEEDIPEGTEVYVLEEPEDQPAGQEGEIMKTANNIVFRPLFRYRGKQEALRRNSNRVRRRYYVPRRSYRQTHRYPHYYPQRYYWT